MLSNHCTGYSFDAFEVHIETETLLHKGRSVRIQQLPFRTLLILLENAGRTVTREELHKRLWADGTFIEFDNNLRVAMTKLREALGEQASEPRLIKTVSRRGYQFIGNALPLVAENAIAEPVAIAEARAVRPVVPQAEVRSNETPLRHRLLKWRTAVAALGLLSGVTVLTYQIHSYRQRPLASNDDRVALGGVANETGDPVFDGVLTTPFRLKLQESPYLSPLHEQDFRRLLGKSDESAPLTEQLKVCTTLGASLFLNGRLIGTNPGYRVEVDVLRCRDGRKMTTEASRANLRAEVLPALNQAIERIRLRLGESQSSLEKFNAPLTQATTGSLVALKAFTLGDRKHSEGQETEAISDYKLAVDLDPQFAMAFARLGTAYLNTKQYSAAREVHRMAFTLRERTTDRERLYITAHYYSSVTGELPRAVEAYQLWRSVYPRDGVPVVNLADIFLSLGNVDQALEMATLAVRLDPLSSAPYALSARAYLERSDFSRLKKLCNDSQLSKTEMVLFHSSCYLASFAQGDAASEQRELQWARGHPQESVMLEYQAWTEVYEGKLHAARKTFEEARRNAEERKMTEFVAELDLDEAGLDADIGQTKEAHDHAMDALKEAPESRSVQAFAAFVLARTGDKQRAQAEADKAVKQAPLDSLQRNTLLASTQAFLQLRTKSVKASLRSMEAVRPFDNVAYMALSPAYYRGLFLTEDHQYNAAKQSFQQVIDHHALYPQSIYIVLSQLQLARALELSGDSEQARIQYESVRKVWRGADADFAPLKHLIRRTNSSR